MGRNKAAHLGQRRRLPVCKKRKKIRSIINRITLPEQRLNPAAPFGRGGSANDIVFTKKWGSLYRTPKILQMINAFSLAQRVYEAPQVPNAVLRFVEPKSGPLL